jgi:soluble lytic murein transglycosylase-like protein
MRRIIVVPAILIGSLIVIWEGTVAGALMPPQAGLAPTLTAVAESQSASQTAVLALAQPSAAHNPEEGPACSLPASFPPTVLRWCPAIEANAYQTGLPASLIAAVVLQESGGDPQAYSHSGAVGLMQIMPRDGLAAEFMCINGPCFASRPTIAELEDPDFNLAYGSRMLADLGTKHGSYREGLFRYGPMDMGYAYADRVLSIWETYR